MGHIAPGWGFRGGGGGFSLILPGFAKREQDSPPTGHLSTLTAPYAHPRYVFSREKRQKKREGPKKNTTGRKKMKKQGLGEKTQRPVARFCMWLCVSLHEFVCEALFAWAPFCPSRSISPCDARITENSEQELRENSPRLLKSRIFAARPKRNLRNIFSTLFLYLFKKLPSFYGNYVLIFFFFINPILYSCFFFFEKCAGLTSVRFLLRLLTFQVKKSFNSSFLLSVNVVRIFLCFFIIYLFFPNIYSALFITTDY